MLDTEVSAVVEIDGVKTTLKKILKEKWVKKRGEVETELKGTESSYYVYEVPFKQVEYKNKIREITGDEDIFKLLTNPLYFSLGLKWQDRRKIIFELNGDVSIEDVINYNDKLGELSNILKPNDNNDNKYSQNSNELRLSQYLFNHIKDNNPSATGWIDYKALQKKRKENKKNGQDC